ncbi:hypothetical protein ACA910_010502 [Epithemia clementina (nom. ined.)]
MALLVPASKLHQLRERGRALLHDNSEQQKKKKKRKSQSSSSSLSSNKGCSSSSSSSCSVLIVGASGTTGSACIRQLAKLRERSGSDTNKHDQQASLEIHAFCRNPAKLEPFERAVCSSVIAGDMRCRFYLAAALEVTHANVVILSVDDNHDEQSVLLQQQQQQQQQHHQQQEGSTNIRTAAGTALANVLSEPRFSDVRVIVVSSATVLCAECMYPRGISNLMQYRFRPVAKDYRGQELAFQTKPMIQTRTTIVRPTNIVSNNKSAKGNVVSFGVSSSSSSSSPSCHAKAPSPTIHRNDLAAWIAQEAVTGSHCGCVMGLTSVAQSRHLAPNKSSAKI